MMRHMILISTMMMTVSLFAQKLDRTMWVDSVLNSMTLEEKVGQVFMIRAFSHDDPSHVADIKEQIEKYHVGGICFFQGDPQTQAQLVKEYQDLADIPLLTAIDGEWGLGMRFPKKAISFPRQMTIGAVNDHQLIFLMGKEIGRQCQLSGINVNFAPVLDVNNNAANPVINNRSFGEDRYNVAAKGYAYMKGLADARVLACGKHFPGHGDTDVDSHLDLPVLPFDRKRLDSIELFPFKMMIDQGIPALMIAHLQVPALDDRPNRPTTLSSKVVTELLRQDLSFDGLVFTDAMEMKGVTKHYDPGRADVAAFLAGNDVITLPQKMDRSYAEVLKAVQEGTITMHRLEESIRRILGAKYDLQLHHRKTQADPNKIISAIQSRQAKVIKAQLYEKAITLVADVNHVFPIIDLANINIGSVSLGSRSLTTFQQRLSSYHNMDHLFIPKQASPKDYDLKIGQLKNKDIVFVSVHDMSRLARKGFGIEQAQIDFVNELKEHTKVVLTVFGSPYAIALFKDVPTIVLGYEEDDLAQEAAAQAMMGAIDITGKLPVSASAQFPAGTGITVPNLNRLGFAIPEAVGLNSDTLSLIKDLIQEIIDTKAAPGCQVLVAKDNRIVYHKAFGHHTYDKQIPVTLTDIYDLASVTKVMASTLCAMHLDDRGLFDLKAPISRYIPEEDTTNKADIIYEDILAHVGGLKPWIPFYASTIEGERKKIPSKRYYRHTMHDSFNIAVTNDLFLRNDYRDTIWRKIFSSSLREQRDYRYSDLAFYIMNRTIKNITGYEVDGYAEMNFYHPLGLRHTLFNPYRVFDKDQIIPSERDDYWRHEVVHGYVHDMGAAMLGGVSGHAGLFSNALDVGILMQMVLNKGRYGGKEYLDPKSINYYTQRHWRSSRRGIGWDMKELNPDKKQNLCEEASRHTFGHMGFTGTMVYADPDYDLIFVFLSNRTYPSMTNNKLGKEDYRQRLHSVVYHALMME